MSKNFTRFLSLTLLVGFCCLASWSYAQECTLEIVESDVVLAGPVCDGGTLTYEVQGYAAELYEFNFAGNGFLASPQFEVAEGTIFTVSIREIATACVSNELIITAPDVDPLSFTVTTEDISCNGARDGVAHIVVTGGFFDAGNPYEILVSNQGWRSISGSTKDIVMTSAGTYQIRARDAYGCETDAQEITIGEPDAITLTLTPGFSAAACPSDEAGHILVAVEGGNDAEYTVALNDADGNEVETAVTTGGSYHFMTGYAAGDYTVVATDSKACEGMATTTIEGIDPIVFSAEVAQDLLCKGATTGIISVTGVGGGTEGAGYVVEVYDAADALVTTAAVVDGAADVSGLAAGDYGVFVRDGNGCLSEAIDLSIWEPAEALMLEATVDRHIGCTEAGEFTISASGGVEGYVYYWAMVDEGTGMVPTEMLPGETTSWTPASEDGTVSVTVETAATFVIWVTDADGMGCMVGGESAPEWSVEIEDAVPPVTFDTDITSPVLCNGDANGEITVSNIDGGESTDYMVSVDGVDIEGMVISDLAAGTYEITVTEVVGGCTTSTSVEITQPDELVITEFIKVEGVFSCPDATEAWLETTVEGGSGSYTYQLYQNEMPFGSVVSIPSFVVPIGATYSVKAMDGNCEVMSESIEVDQVMDITFSVKDLTCFGEESVTVMVSASGEPGHTFEVAYAPVVGGVEGALSAWTPFDATVELEGLSYVDANEGNYEFYVRYALYECGDASENITLTPVESELTATVAQDDIEVTLTPAGGEAPYTYELNGAAAAGPDFVLIEGENTITVMDSRGCTYDVMLTADPISLTAVPASGDNMTQTFDVVLTFNREVTIAEGDITGGTYTPGTASEFTVAMSGADEAVLTLTVGTAIADAAGNTFAGAEFTYTIGDNTAPTLVDYTPTGQLDDNHPEFVITFSEDVILTSAGGNLVITQVGASEARLVIPFTADDIDGTVVTVTYEYDPEVGGLDRQVEYFVNIDAGTFEDAAGNEFAGLNDQTTWTFRTGDWATAVDDQLGGSMEFSVYPNPFDGYITVKNASKLSRIIISNVAGQRVKDLVNPTENIQTGDLRSGIYFITLVDQDDKIARTERIVKQ